MELEHLSEAELQQLQAEFKRLCDARGLNKIEVLEDAIEDELEERAEETAYR